ncbi:hypothetical protein OD90_0690 [Dokdonia sp. Hel_I_53]|nr:hypothetical protein OD90_0690 [Dokdonia sp. Hel_I_53]
MKERFTYVWKKKYTGILIINIGYLIIFYLLMKRYA